MSTQTRLYNQLAHLVLVARQVRANIAKHETAKYNLEDLAYALEKSETLLLKTNINQRKK